MNKLTLLFIIVYVCFVNGALTPEQIENLKKFHKECADETGVDVALVKQAREGQFVEDDKFKNHIFCVFKKVGFLNDAGDVQKDVLKAKVSLALDDPALAEQLISKCAIPRGSGPETAYQTIKCYKENNPKHIAIV